MKKNLLKFGKILFVSLILSVTYSIGTSFATEYDWMGGNCSTKYFSDASCWWNVDIDDWASSAPTSGDVLNFWSVDSSSAFVNTTSTFYSIYVSGGYTGTIKVNSGVTLNISTNIIIYDGLFWGSSGSTVNVTGSLSLLGGDYRHDGTALNVTTDLSLNSANSAFVGQYNSGGYINVDRNFVITSGTFSSVPGTLYVAQNFTVGASGVFNHSNGLVVLDSALYTTMDINVSVNLYSLTFNKTNPTNYLYVPGSDIINVSGVLTLGNGVLAITNSANIIATGTINWLSTFDGAYSSAYIGYITIKTTASVTIANGQQNIPSLKLDNTNFSNLYLYTGGTSPISFTGNFMIDTGTGVGAYFLNGATSITFANLFTMNNGWFYSGTGSTITHNKQVTVSAGNYRVNNDSNIIFGVSAELEINGGFFRAYANTTVDLNMNSVTSLDFNGGTLIAPTTMYVAGGWDQESGATFTNSSGTVIFDGVYDSYIDVVSGINFYNLKLAKSSNVYGLITGASDIYNVLGNLELGVGKLGVNSASEMVALNTINWTTDFNGLYSTSYLGYLTIKTTTGLVIPSGQTNIPSLNLDNTNVSNMLVTMAGSTDTVFAGNFRISSGIQGGAAFENTYNANLTFNFGTYLYNGALVSGTGNSVTHDGIVDIYSGNYYAGAGSSITFGTNAELHLDGGTFNATGATSLDLNSTSATSFDFNSGSFYAPITMYLAGTWDQESGTSFYNINGTVVMNGTGSHYIYNPDQQHFYNLVIDKTSLSDTVYFGSGLNIDGNLSIEDGTFRPVNSTYGISLAGNWSVTSPARATYINVGNTVIFNGVDQVITGSTTFYKFTKNASVPSVLTFEAGSTQIVSDVLTLTGSNASNMLSLRSSSTGTRWNINPQSSRVVGFIDVKDSYNTNVTEINAGGTGSIDSGNNINWNFGDKYWVGSAALCSGSWNDVNCWSGTAGGSGGSAVPDSGSIAHFTSNDSGNCSINANVNVKGLWIDSGYSGTITGNSTYSVTIGVDRFLQLGGTVNMNGSNMTNNDNFYLYGGTFNSGTGAFVSQAFYFNYASSMNAAANFSNASSMTVNGAFVFGSSMAPLNTSSGSFVAPAVMNVGGSFYAYTGNTTTFNANNGLVNFNGTAASSYSYNGVTFNDVSINKTLGGSFTVGTNIDINGDFTLTSGTLTVTGANTIYLGGNWNKSVSSAFIENYSKLLLDGTNQAINGTNTFYQLTKNVTSSATLTFEAGKTQTISNNLSLQGVDGQLLSLRSSVTDTQWSINHTGQGTTIAYLDVKDSNNINATAIDTTGTGSFDSGNNTNWVFDVIANTYIDSFATFNGNVFAGIYSTSAKIVSMVAPYTNSWSVVSQPSGVDRLKSFATFNGALYVGGDIGGKIFKRSDQGFDLYSTSDVTNGAFEHIAITYDKDLLTQNAKMYLNGVLDSTFDFTSLLDSNALNLLIGQSYGSTLGGSNASGEENFAGGIDEFRISNSEKSVDWLNTVYNNLSSPSTFVVFGAQESRPAGVPGGGTVGGGSGLVYLSSTALNVNSVIGAGELSMVSGGIFSNGGINLSVSATSAIAQSATWTWDEVNDYFSFTDASSIDGFHVNLFMSSTDAGNFVYSGPSQTQTNIPAENFKIYGGVNLGSGSAASKGVDDPSSTLNIISAESCVEGANLSRYNFDESLTTGPDYGMSLSRDVKTYLRSTVPCVVKGSFDIRRASFEYPEGAQYGTYSSILHIVLIDGQ